MNLKIFVEAKLNVFFNAASVFFKCVAIGILSRVIEPLFSRFIEAHKINRLNRQLIKECKKAKKFAAATGRKQLVLFVNGRFGCYTKQHLNELIKRHYFKKGTTTQDLEKLAKYITP